MKMKIMTVVILAILNPVSSIAQEAGGPLDVSLAIGYVGTSGNTKTTTFNSEILANYRTENWLHNVKFQALGSTEDSTSKAERYYLEDKSDFFLNSEDYLFAKGSYNDDRFSGFEYQATLSAGYGRYLINNDNFTFQGFGGAGYRINDVINAVSQDEVIFSIGENLEWRISEMATLTQGLTSEIGSELTITILEVGLVTNIIDQISTKIAFQARNTSEVPFGTKKTDTQTSINLVYTF